MLRLAGAFITIKIKTIKLYVFRSFSFSFFLNPAMRRFVFIYNKNHVEMFGSPPFVSLPSLSCVLVCLFAHLKNFWAKSLNYVVIFTE